MNNETLGEVLCIGDEHDFGSFPHLAGGVGGAGGSGGCGGGSGGSGGSGGNAITTESTLD